MVSHLAMLPFVLLLVWSFYKISLFFFKKKQKSKSGCYCFFLCIESTLLAQSTLVSYDVAMVAGFLFGLYSILYKKRDWLYWVLILLALLSVRSVVSMACLFFIDFYFRWKEEKFNLSGFIFPYFIGTSLVVGIFTIIQFLVGQYLVHRANGQIKDKLQLCKQ